MLSSLYALEADDLSKAASLAGLEEEVRSPQELIPRLVDWAAGVVGCPSREPAEVERAVVEWLCARWKVPLAPGEDLRALEQRLWATVSTEAAEHVLPVWKVASAMAAIGPAPALRHEMALLERAAARLVPSQEALDRMEREWMQMCQPPVQHASQVLDRVRPEVQRIACRPELVTPTLVLCQVVALADGNYELQEGRLYDAVAAGLGVQAAVAQQLRHTVTQRFWTCRDGAPADLPVAQRGRITLLAAHCTLEQSGALLEIEEEIQSGFLAGLHRSLFEDPDFRRGMRAWQSAPFMWPLGFAYGICLYLRGRIRGADQRNLTRLLLLAAARERLGAPASA